MGMIEELPRKFLELISSQFPSPKLIRYFMGILIFGLACVALGFAIKWGVEQSSIRPISSDENVALMQAIDIGRMLDCSTRICYKMGS